MRRRGRPHRLRSPQARPTVRQVYTVARELCERCGESFPETREEASELIAQLREDNARPPHAILASLMRDD